MFNFTNHLFGHNVFSIKIKQKIELKTYCISLFIFYLINLSNKFNMPNQDYVYLPGYYLHDAGAKYLTNSDQIITQTCGIFSVNYTTTNALYPNNSFGLYSWKSSHQPIEAKFYKNNVEIFTKQFNKSPSIVIHGDGENENMTFFTFNDCNSHMHGINVYNMNNEFVKNKILGYDMFVELKRVNEKYAICVCEEMCTYSQCTGLVNLDILFGLTKQIETTEQTKRRPYSNARVHVPFGLDYFEETSIYPMIATNTGFITFNKYNTSTSYTFTKPNFVPYDDVFNELIDFYENANKFDFSSALNISPKTQMQIDSEIEANNCVLIRAINNDTKTLFDNINSIYNEYQNKLNAYTELTFAMIKPDAMSKGFDKYILDALKCNRINVLHKKIFQFDADSVDKFYAEHIGKSFYNNLKEFMMSGPSMLLILSAPHCVIHWRNLIGPTFVNVSKQIAPYSLRAIYGDSTNNSLNAVHGSDSRESADREIEFFNQI